MERGLILLSDAAVAARDLLGVPIGVRAALSLAETGLQSAGVVVGEHELPAWANDARARIALSLAHGEVGVRLVVRAEAMIAPRSLRELPMNTALADAKGERIAARIELRDDQDLRAQFDTLPVHTFTPDAEHYALHLTDAASVREAERILFHNLVKSSDGPVSRHFNRHISRAITRVVLPWGMTPNTMTVFVAIAGVLAAWCASQASYQQQVLGAALYQFHSIIDGCDGEIARLTQRFGKHGALIDSLVDDLCNFIFFVGLSIGVAHSLHATWPLHCAYVTAFAYVGVIAVQYGVVLRATGRGDKTKFWVSPEAQKVTLFSLVKILLRRDAFVLLIFVAVALGLAPAAVAVFPFAALGTLGASLQRLRALRAED